MSSFTLPHFVMPVRKYYKAAPPTTVHWLLLFLYNVRGLRFFILLDTTDNSGSIPEYIFHLPPCPKLEYLGRALYEVGIITGEVLFLFCSKMGNQGS